MEEIQKYLQEIVGRIFGVDEQIDLTIAPSETGADYATNVAMKLAKVAHKSPMAIAEEIKAEFIDKSDIEIEVAAPGFLNFRLTDEYFSNEVQKYLENGLDNISPDEYRDRVIVTEFSDPNPFKVLHVGHLYTSIVGDSISRLLEFAGAKVKRTNFGGDVGLHVAKTLWAVKQHHYSSGDITIQLLGDCYVEGTRAYEDDETAKDEITGLNKEIYRISAMGRETSEQLGGEEGELAKLYFRGRELSYQYFEEFYARIGLKFDKFYPESTVADKGLGEVCSHIGTTYEESDGAVVYRGEKVGLHTRVFINREGVPTYETKDVGLLFTKWADWHFDESVVITGNEQSDYMKVVLSSVNEYAPELVERTRHLTHGMVRLPGNEKMSSRKGNFIKAVDVLEMVREAMASEQGSADEKIVLAAIKYAFLKYRMGGDIIFDPKESVSTTGNSGVYLLYSAVRAKKILQKTEVEDSLNKKFVQQEELAKQQEYVRSLNKKIVQYGGIIREAIREKAPYKVCVYLYELAQEFSRFYEHVPVAGSTEMEQRKMVVQAYLNVMEHGLGLLGIEVPDQM